MELILFIGGIWLIIKIYEKFTHGGSINRHNQSTNTSNRSPKKKQNNQTFRPSSTTRTKSKINFKVTSSTSINNVPAASDLEGLHDAFTGAPLDKGLGLYQCQSCMVYYHTESLQVLREVNNSQCVACQSSNIIVVTEGAQAAGGKDYTPNVVTLQNYKQHEGSVVTFEGRVHKVNESRRGNDFAVMFEDKTWVKGFKLVFFSGAVRKVGGASYINSLAGKTIKVRGLIIKHQRFGYEIIVSEKSMIVSVE